MGLKFRCRFLFLAILSVFIAFGQNRKSPKLAPEFQGADSDQLVDVIVKFKDEPSDFQRSLATRRGGRMVRSLDVINSHHYRIPAGQLAELSEDPSIEFIHPDRVVQASGSSVQPDYSWVSLLNLPSPFSNTSYSGNGVGVAVIDSGINTAHDLTNLLFFSRVVYSQSFVAGDTGTNDTYGHGTHVTGIIGGDGSSSNGSSPRVSPEVSPRTSNSSTFGCSTNTAPVPTAP